MHREYFNGIAHKWDEMVNHDPEKLSKIFEMIDLKAGQKVLDVGTGTGVLIRHIYDRVGDEGHIDALDISEKMVEEARKKYAYTNLNFIIGDVCNITINRAAYDCIICYNVFPHFGDKKRAVYNMAQWLKKDGKLVVCHSQSREKVNEIHLSGQEFLKADLLPPAESVGKMMEEVCLTVYRLIDSDELYFVGGIK
ncbi:MAG: class I SAM-dependent methyltransferase [Clostridiales bacterium]|jgi:demethylmenaquinone methyltransferase/2-methoxy-6-polyprenyl-1,4-benzoquinol methylase|nr:class I SAM-dependent methyltransferase [Clostridiales bacterium]